MKKNYQTTTHGAALTLPEAVTMTVGELVDELEEGLLAFAVGAGLKVVDVLFGGRGRTPDRAERKAQPGPAPTRAHIPRTRRVPTRRPRVPAKRPRAI